MATRINAHEERLATLNSIMNVIALLDMDAPRRSLSDRWIDVRAIMQPFETETDDEWSLGANHSAEPERFSESVTDSAGPKRVTGRLFGPQILPY